MPNEMWKASNEVHQMLRELVGQNHPDLAILIGATRDVDEIQIIFKEKSRKAGGKVDLGAVRRVSPVANALGNTNYKFVIELPADVWEHDLDSKQREALLDYHLCACRCEEDKSGEMKCSKAKPDFIAFRENLERYGMWFPKDASSDEGADDESIEEMLDLG